MKWNHSAEWEIKNSKLQNKDHPNDLIMNLYYSVKYFLFSIFEKFIEQDQKFKIYKKASFKTPVPFNIMKGLKSL